MYPDQSPFSAEPSAEKFILTYVLPTCLRAASKCGINVLEFMQEVGVSPLTLLPGHGSLPMKELFTLLGQGTRAGWAARPGGHLPLVFAEFFQFDYLPDASACFLSSPNLLEASKVFNWISALYCPPAKFEFHMNKEFVTVVLKYEDAFNDPQACWTVSETILATWYRFACRMSTSAAQPQLVEFRHEAHPMRSECNAFFGVECQFGALRDAITLPRQWVEAPLDTSVPILHEHAKERLRQALSRAMTGPIQAMESPALAINDFGIVRKVFDYLSSQPAQLSASLSEVAAALDLPIRSLQRRLSESGTSFSQVQAKARLFAAKRLLLEESTPIENIGLQVGFPDRRSFSSFFKRQTGFTPREWRRSRGIH